MWADPPGAQHVPVRMECPKAEEEGQDVAAPDDAGHRFGVDWVSSKHGGPKAAGQNDEHAPFGERREGKDWDKPPPSPQGRADTMSTTTQKNCLSRGPSRKPLA